MSGNDERSISLAAYIKWCDGLIKFSGCVWKWSWNNCSYQRFKNTFFKTYFFGLTIYLVATSTYLLTLDDPESFSRQIALTLAIINNNMQILVLYIKRDAFDRLIHATPDFSNKKAIVVQLKYAMKIVTPWMVVKGVAYLAIFALNILTVAERLSKNFEDEVQVKIVDQEDYFSALKIAGFAVRLMRVYTLTSMFAFQFGMSWLLMTVLVFINGYLNHLKLCLLRVKIRDPLRINVDWIGDYDVANGDYDMRYCVTMHQFIIRLVDLTNEVFSWVIQLVIWQTLKAFIFGIKLFLQDAPSAGRLFHFTIIYVLEMLCYCYLADDINRKSTNLATICYQKLYEAGDLIVGDWKTLQVVAVRIESEALVIKGGPFYVLKLRTFIAMFAVSLTLISVS